VAVPRSASAWLPVPVAVLLKPVAKLLAPVAVAPAPVAVVPVPVAVLLDPLARAPDPHSVANGTGPPLPAGVGSAGAVVGSVSGMASASGAAAARNLMCMNGIPHLPLRGR